MQIFHSVNAGLYLQTGDANLLVDGIPCDANTGFSPMPETLRRDMETGAGLFAHLSGLLFTHLHPDHFDPARLSSIRAYPSPPPFYGPGLDGSASCTEYIAADMQRLSIGPWHILSVKTIHEGAVFSAVEHRSFLLQHGETGILVAGDAILGEREAALFQNYGPKINAAFLNPYQLLSPHGQAFLRYLEPESVYLYHLPFSEHDWLGCHALAKQAEKRYPRDLPSLQRVSPMAWIDRTF